MHLLGSVLSGEEVYSDEPVEFVESYCTFWRSVLSGFSAEPVETIDGVRLNAPFGARCFLAWMSTP